METTTLVLVRHGESEWNRLNLFTGWTDVALSETGCREAAQAGLILQEEGYDFDFCCTSYLKRAIETLNLILYSMDREWLPVEKNWRLNERHYGTLQGLNKAQTAQKYGEEQVKLWRRSFAIAPPLLDEADERNPRHQLQYRGEALPQGGTASNNKTLPLGESLKDTIDRVIPYFKAEILPRMEAGQRLLIVAHGNSLRALMKHFENLSEEEISEVNLPTGVPLVYELDSHQRAVSKKYLGDASAVAAKMQAVASQGKAKRNEE